MGGRNYFPSVNRLLFLKNVCIAFDNFIYHNITEILLKVTLNTMNQTKPSKTDYLNPAWNIASVKL